MTEEASATSFLAWVFGECQCRGIFDCSLPVDRYGILLWLGIAIYMFRCLGSICEEYFVPSLEVMVDKLGITPDVAGATFMAVGSSAPELFTSMVATFLIVSTGGLGTIIGSAVFNVLVICGLIGIVGGKDRPLKIWWYPLLRDSVFYAVSILEVMFILWDEKVVWYEALFMLLTYVVYIAYMKINPRIVGKLERKGFEVPPPRIGKIKSRVVTERWKEVDSPGDYFMTTPAFVRKTEDPGSLITGHLATSTQVKVLEVVLSDDEMKVMGRIEEPRGWIVLLHTKNGLRDAKKEGDGNVLREGAKSKEQSPAPPGTVGVTEDLLETTLREPPTEGEAEAGAVGAAEAATPEEDAEIQSGTTDETLHEEISEAQRVLIKDPLSFFFEIAVPDPEDWTYSVFAFSITFIGICTYLMVDSVHRVGCIMRAPPFAMGTLVLAAGTSIPDTYASLAVARQGEGDMAVANALGSNVFDILVGLGLPWTLRLMAGKPVEFPGEFKHLAWDFLFLVLVVVVLVGSLMRLNWLLTRRMGLGLLSIYSVYVLLQIIASATWRKVEPMEI